MKGVSEMKKLFLLLLSVLGLLVAFILEKGSLSPLRPVATAVIPLFLGILFTTMFSFQFKEIINTFKSAFSEETNSNNIREYHKSLLIVKNLQSSTTFWAGTILIMAIIQLLCDLTTPEKMGPSVAAALTALLYGFGLRAVFLIPMEHNLNKKIFLSEDK
jgi:flagellar motor component MotA